MFILKFIFLSLFWTFKLLEWLAGISRPRESETQIELKISEFSSLETQLVEEYKILQTKFDKIGEFQFHVKNWAFTLTLAIWAGGFAAKLPPTWILIASFCPTLIFWRLDCRQARWKKMFGSRIRYLETLARRNSRIKFQSLPTTIAKNPACISFGIESEISRQKNKNSPNKRRIGTDESVYLMLFFFCWIVFLGAINAGRNTATNSITKPEDTTATKEETPKLLQLAEKCNVTLMRDSWFWLADPEQIKEHTSLDSER